MVSTCLATQAGLGRDEFYLAALNIAEQSESIQSGFFANTLERNRRHNGGASGRTAETAQQRILVDGEFYGFASIGESSVQDTEAASYSKLRLASDPGDSGRDFASTTTCRAGSRNRRLVETGNDADGRSQFDYA